jgi:hypothetical protein
MAHALDRPTRSASRRCVELACQLIRSSSEVPELCWATDLSTSGAWVDTSQPLQTGEIVVVCIEPTGLNLGSMTIFARVARGHQGKRIGDFSAGSGLELLDLDPSQALQLTGWLSKRQHRQPRLRKRRSIVQPSAHPFAFRCN